MPGSVFFDLIMEMQCTGGVKTPAMRGPIMCPEMRVVVGLEGNSFNMNPNIRAGLAVASASAGRIFVGQAPPEPPPLPAAARSSVTTAPARPRQRRSHCRRHCRRPRRRRCRRSQPSQPTAAAPVTTRPFARRRRAAPTQPANQHELTRVQVTGNLEQSLQQIAPSLGAASYTLGPEQIQTIPEGENAPFQQLLLRTPGVVIDSFGQYPRPRRTRQPRLTASTACSSPSRSTASARNSTPTSSIRSASSTAACRRSSASAPPASLMSPPSPAPASTPTKSPCTAAATTRSSPRLPPAARRQVGLLLHRQLQAGQPGHRKPHAPATRPSTTTPNRRASSAILPITSTTPAGSACFSTHRTPTFRSPTSPASRRLSPWPASPPPIRHDLDENQNEQQYYGVLSYQKVSGDLSFQLSGFSQLRRDSLHAGRRRTT